MTFEAIFNAAADVINNIAAAGEVIGPDKTVCVICSRSGRIYYGVSRNDIHAEVDAMRNMQGLGEKAIDQLILLNASTRTAMLPCNNCVGFILSQNPENAGAQIAMPDRMIPLSDIGRFTGGGAPPIPPPAPAKSISAKNDLLKNRVSSLMEGIDDDDEENQELLEELDKPKKKKLFGLFG